MSPLESSKIELNITKIEIRIFLSFREDLQNAFKNFNHYTAKFRLNSETNQNARKSIQMFNNVFLIKVLLNKTIYFIIVGTGNHLHRILSNMFFFIIIGS